MASLDPSIILQGKPAQIENPLVLLAQGEQYRAAQTKNKLLDMQLQQEQRAVADQQALGELTRAAYDPDTGTIDPAKVRSGLAQAGNYGALTAFDTKQLAQQKAQREADKARLESVMQNVALQGQLLGGVTDQASYDAARQHAQQNGVDVSKLPPMYDPNMVSQLRARALTAAQQVEQEWKQKGYDQKEQQAAETRRHNQATEGNAASRLAFDQNAPRGQVVQTDQGTMLVDQRTGQSRPVTDPSGQPVQKPGREIPASVNKSIIENQQNIGKIDQAIAAIQARPGSVGTINMIPGAEIVRQYTDPEGIEARAGVADVGSLILHDRSGAAVTASETPRLKPFIPSASDRPEVAIKKLQRFKELYQQEAGLLADTYSKSQGYRESPALSGQKTGSKPKPSLADIFGN